MITPTPSSPGVRVVSTGAGREFATTDIACNGLVNNFDCVGNQQMLIVESYDPPDFSAVHIQPGNVNDQFYVIFRPVPGDSHKDYNPAGPLTYGAQGQEATFNTDSPATIYSGVAIDNYRVKVIGNNPDTRGAAYFQRNSGTLIQGFRHCLFDVESPAQRIFEAGSGYGNCMLQDSTVIMQASATGVFFASYGNPWMSIQRNTFHRKGGVGAILADLFYGDVRDNVFSNLGAPAVKGNVSANSLFNNVSDYNGGGEVANTTVLPAGSLLVDTNNDLRPKPDGPLIGAASDTARQTYDSRGGYRGQNPDLGGSMYTAAVAPQIANAVITKIELFGQKVVVTGTYNSVADTATASLPVGANPNGAVAANGAVVFGNGAFTATFTKVAPGGYGVPVIKFKNLTGTGGTTGGDVVNIAVPALPTVSVSSQSHDGTHMTISGKVTGFPTDGTVTMTPLASSPNGATAKTGPITINDAGTFTAEIDVSSGNYDKPTVSVSNATGTSTGQGVPTSLYANGSAPSGYPAVDLIPYQAPAFDTPSVDLGMTVANVSLENTTGLYRVSQSFTFGLVLPKGAMKMTDGLIAADPTNGAAIRIQVDAKSSWQDGSMRHAIISAHLSSLNIGEVRAIKLKRQSFNNLGDTPIALSDYMASANNPTPTVVIVESGITYTADVNAALSAPNAKILNWLTGPEASEFIIEVPLLANGTAHSGLRVYAHMRWHFNNRGKLDIVVENCDAYSPGLHDYTYDVTVNIKGSVLFSQSGLTHYSRARWKKSFVDLLAYWVEAHDAINVQFNPHEVINTKMFPNILVPDTLGEPLLNANYGDQVYTQNGGGYDVSPMRNGIYAPAMGTTGGRPEIGLQSRWICDWLVSQDKRVRKWSLYHADIGGSWSSHLRDRSTGPANGQILDVVHWPYGADIGTDGDCTNPATGKLEAFKFQDSSTYMTADVAHHSAFSQAAYALTGDYYYLEELIFWCSFVTWHQNPYYRAKQEGLIVSDQVRGQAWSLRDFGDAAALIPDNSPYKATWNYILERNLNYYNTNYSDNPNANPLGTIQNGYSVSYNVKGAPNANGVSTWMDAFFTSAVGHISEMGFSSADRLLYYKARTTIEMLTNKKYCWIFAATYGLAVKDGVTGVPFQNWDEAYRGTQTEAMQSMPWASQAMADQYDSEIPNAPGSTHAGEIPGFAYSAEGYPANIQSGLAFAVDSGYPGGLKAWEQFEARTLKPNYAIDGLQFSQMPRSYNRNAVQHPGAPTGISASLGSNGIVTVSFNAPAYTGNSPITKYTVHGSDGTATDGLSSPIQVSQSDLTHANYYVTASNTAGEGPQSAGTNWIAGTNSGATDPVPTVNSVVVSPATATGSQKFSASVLGTNNPSQVVTWTSVQQTITVTATSGADPTKSGKATVTIAAQSAPPPAPIVTGVTVAPSAATLSGNASKQFAASVQGANSPSQGVTWSATGGQINTSGLFVAPSATQSPQTITVTATSTQDPTKSGTAVVTVPALVQSGPTARTVVLKLKDHNGSPVPNAGNLSWCVHAQLKPGQYTAPIAQGDGATSDTSANVALNFSSTIALGSLVKVEVTESDGTLNQSPAPRSFVGLVEVQ
jgi:hypothetical protein